MNKLSPQIDFLGLTHLGINSLVAAAEKGFSVVGFDQDINLVEALTNGNIDINEPGLAKTLAKNKSRVSFSNSEYDLYGCSILYISADVPTNEFGVSDLSPIDDLVDQVLAFIKPSQVLVILCQVPPGFTRKVFEKHNNTIYQVETLIFGRAMERALFPERFILGVPQKNNLSQKLQEYLAAFNCPVIEMAFESAELSKTAINLMLAANVSVANTLAEVCEKINADWSEIVPALRLDKRIGQYSYIEAGLGLSGGNIERDLKTVSNLAVQTKSDPRVVDSFILNSAKRKSWLADCFQEISAQHENIKIGVLGLAYKKDTHSTKNSPALELIKSTYDATVKAYDPAVKDLPGHSNVILCKNPLDAADGADAVFFATPWDEFLDINGVELLRAMKHSIIVDPYGIRPDLKTLSSSYFRLGRG